MCVCAIFITLSFLNDGNEDDDAEDDDVKCI